MREPPEPKPPYDDPIVIEGKKGSALIYYEDRREGYPDVWRVRVRTIKRRVTNAEDFKTRAEAIAWAREKLRKQR